MSMTRKTIGSLVTVGIMLTAVACSGPADEGPGVSTVNVGVSALPLTLDPGHAESIEAYAAMHLVGGTLTEMSPDGSQISMGLAASVTPEGKGFIVKLKPNLKFSDGSPLTATDVVASFERYLGDKTNINRGSISSIEKVTATDDLTVSFDLNRPYPSLPSIFAQPQTLIIPAKFIKEKGVQDLYKGDPPPSSGQFMVDSFDDNQMTLQANPEYAGTQPSTKTVVFKKIPDSAARLAQLQSGQIDFAQGISAKDAQQLSAPVEARTTYAASGGSYLQFNNRDNSVLSDVRIRQSLAVAVNRDQINQVAYAGQNRTLRGLWANASKYSAPFLPEQPDLGRARELLAGTKCADGCTLRLIVSASNQPRVDTAVVVQQNLKAIGVQVEIEKLPTAAYQERLSGNFDLLVGGVYDAGQVPDSILGYVVGPDLHAAYTGYSSPEMNRLIKEVSETSDSARDTAVKQVDALFKKDLPFAPLADYVVVSGSRVPANVFELESTLLYHVG